MARREPYELIYDPGVRPQLGWLGSKHYALIRDEIERQLRFEPDTETRNRKPLRRPSVLGTAWSSHPGGRREDRGAALDRGRGVPAVRIAPVADVKARFSRDLAMCADGPIVVTKNGRPTAVLVAVSDEAELERLVLAHTPRFTALLDAAERRIKKGRGIKHTDFWETLKAD